MKEQTLEEFIDESKKAQMLIEGEFLSVVTKSPTKKPYFYTDHEGGDWIDWPKDKHFYYLPWLRLRDTKTVNMGGLLVHSLAFGCMQAGRGQFQRWDCINGFDDVVVDPLW